MQRTVFLTGASGGIGQAIAARLTAAGLTILGFDTQAPGTLSSLTGFTAVDVSDSAALTAAFTSAAEQYGAPAHLVVAAGVIITGRIEDTTQEDAHRAFAANTFGVLNSLRAGIPLLDRHRSPSVVVVSSNAAKGLFKVRGEGERRVAGVERPVVLL